MSTDVVADLLADWRQQIEGSRLVDGGDCSYVDGYGRTFTLDSGEVTVTEEGCAGEVSATITLPVLDEVAALPVARAILTAMGVLDDYDLVKRDA